eukprot:1148090-Pelagomonas_calceolata.AAC.2
MLAKEKEKGKAPQAAHTSSVVLREGRPPPPQGLELGTPRRLDEDVHMTRLCISTHRSPIHLSGLQAVLGLLNPTPIQLQLCTSAHALFILSEIH